jgi:hypothetical protein
VLEIQRRGRTLARPLLEIWRIVPRPIEATAFAALIPRIHQLRTVDRLGVLRDAYALSRSGDMSAVELLKIIRSIGPHETDYSVWRLVAEAEGAVKGLLRDDKDHRSLYNAFAAGYTALLRTHWVGWRGRKRTTVPLNSASSCLSA